MAGALQLVPERAGAIMKCRWNLLLTAFAVLLGGCPAPQQAPPVNPAATQPAPQTANKANNYVLLVHLGMASIEVPAGVASGSEEIWSYLDEEAVRQVRSASIGLNGIRIGRGRKNTWPDLAKVLQQMTGRTLQESVKIALPGAAIPIVLKSAQPEQAVFLFNQDRTLKGAYYPPGDYQLTISCSLDQDDPSKVLITGVPQIQTARRSPKFIDDGQGIMMVTRPDVYSLAPLSFQVTVPADDFLVIGPGLESARPGSVGHAFLVKTREGMEFETVLVLKVRVVATEAQPIQTKQLP
jgi:hypothetical protein